MAQLRYCITISSPRVSQQTVTIYNDPGVNHKLKRNSQTEYTIYQTLSFVPLSASWMKLPQLAGNKNCSPFEEVDRE